METLEIKHLAAYLPYKINLQYIIRDRVVKTGIMKTIIHNEADTHPTKISIDWDDAEHIWMFKPILRPLSDLTKEIEVDGKRFVPIDIFEISDSENADEYDFGNVKLIRSLRILANYGIVNDVKYLPYGVIQLLLSWHFDIFGLIDKGLAVNINELEAVGV